MQRLQGTKKKLKIGIVGCGSIGTVLVRSCREKFKENVGIVALNDLENKKALILKDKFGLGASVCSVKELIKKSDLVIEAASVKVSAKLTEQTVALGKDIMVMSVGGLVDRLDLFQKAITKNCKIYLPSGAICGLDGLKAAKEGSIKSVTLTTRKPCIGLTGAPYLKKKKINLNSIKKDTVVFKGSAAQAIKAFPKNINVSAILSLAGIGPRKTKVNIITSPKYKKNIHEIEITGDFGRIHTRCENVPSKENPKTSMLAPLSAIAMLEAIISKKRIGT